LRVISWNIKRSTAAIDFAFDELKADVLLAQECNLLTHPNLESVGHFISERWVSHKWGNVIFSKLPLQAIELNSEYKGSLTVASVPSELGKLALINIYGLFEPVMPGSRLKNVNPGLHRKLSDLTPMLWNRVKYGFDGFLLMGDLNHDRRMDTLPSFKRKGAFPAQRLMERIEDFQMTDLLLRDYPEYVQTYRAVRGNFPWQLDHAFASTKHSKRIRSTVFNSSEIESLSDHNPVVVDIF
jgi:exonuclease III